MTRTFAALVLFASAAASAMPTAVEHGTVVPVGLQFQKTIVLDQTLKTEQGDTLSKGSYEVRFESLPGNKARATFFQGVVKRGDAQGTIVLGGTHAGPGREPHTNTLGSLEWLEIGMYYFFEHEHGNHQLVVGKQGANQIVIALLPPGAPVSLTSPRSLQPTATPTKSPARR